MFVFFFAWPLQPHFILARTGLYRENRPARCLASYSHAAFSVTTHVSDAFQGDPCPASGFCGVDECGEWSQGAFGLGQPCNTPLNSLVGAGGVGMPGGLGGYGYGGSH